MSGPITDTASEAHNEPITNDSDNSQSDTSNWTETFEDRYNGSDVNFDNSSGSDFGGGFDSGGSDFGGGFD